MCAIVYAYEVFSCKYWLTETSTSQNLSGSSCENKILCDKIVDLAIRSKEKYNLLKSIEIYK